MCHIGETSGMTFLKMEFEIKSEDTNINPLALELDI